MSRTPFSAPRATSGTAMSASGSGGVPGTKTTRGSRCAWFVSTDSRCSAGAPLAQPRLRLEDLLLPVAAPEHRHEHLLRLVGLVDAKLVVRDEVAQRVRDPAQQRLDVLLREDVVEDLGQPPIGGDEG